MRRLLGLFAFWALAAGAACSLRFQAPSSVDSRSDEEERAQAEEASKRVFEDYRKNHPEAWAQLVRVAPSCDAWDGGQASSLVCVQSLFLIESGGPEATTQRFALHWDDSLRQQALSASAESPSVRERWERDARELDQAMRAIMLPVLRDYYARCPSAHCEAMRAPTQALVLDSRASFEAWQAAVRAAPAEAPADAGATHPDEPGEGR